MVSLACFDQSFFDITLFLFQEPNLAGEDGFDPLSAFVHMAGKNRNKGPTSPSASSSNCIALALANHVCIRHFMLNILTILDVIRNADTAKCYIGAESC